MSEAALTAKRKSSIARQMNRLTVLKLIAAAIFIAAMFCIQQGVSWFVGWASKDFTDGVLVGMLLMSVGFLFANWIDRSAAFSRRGDQGPRDSIDL
jgi:hypothetical protein